MLTILAALAAQTCHAVLSEEPDDPSASLPLAETEIPCPPDEITVVGRVALRESPATVTRLSPDGLRAQAIPSLEGALALVPGAQVVETGPLGAQASVFLRGADSDHTLVTLDGIRLNSPATPNGLYSVGSDLLTPSLGIEVLRGPASATYGSDAIGGVVAITPPRGNPDRIGDGTNGSLGASVGELGTVQADGAVSGTRGPLTFDLGAAYARTEGWDALPGRIVPEERAGERDGGEGVMLTAFADYEASERVTLRLTALHRAAEAEFDTFSGGPSGFQRADDPDLSSVDTLSVLRLGGTFSAEAWSVTANLGGVRGRFEETDAGTVTGDVRGDRVFAEVLGALERGDTTASAGLLYEDERADIPVSFNDPLEASEDHVGAFVFAQRAARGVTLSAALRLDEYEAFGTALTWNAGAAWSVGDVRLRANAGTAFNAPSLAERFSTSAFNVGNPDLREEEAAAGEVAVAYVRTRWTAEAVLFRTETDDLIEYDFASARNVNVGDARAQGAELSLAYRGPRLTAFAAYTNTDAVNEETGEALLRRPEHGVTAQADWRATDRLSLSGRYAHTGPRPDVVYDDQGFFAGTGDTDGYGLAAMTARYAVTDRLSVFGTATNVSDERYEPASGFGGAPRRVRAGARYAW